MATVYILGAGFSKACGIATDLEMLGALNPMLKTPVQPKDPDAKKTTIDYFLEQNFSGRKQVGFELFMSTLSANKFLIDSLGPGRNVSREGEKELQKTLRRYLRSRVSKAIGHKGWQAVIEFVRQVDWKRDYILTFNYDLLVESAAETLGLNVKHRIIHLHGRVDEKKMAWPTYTKFAYKTTKAPLGPRWKSAFDILRGKSGGVDKLVFIGYSMPPSDLEAKNLFNYSDWYNNQLHNALHADADGNVGPSRSYSYDIVVVNPSKDVQKSYWFFRKKPIFLHLTLERWLKNIQKIKRQQ